MKEIHPLPSLIPKKIFLINNILFFTLYFAQRRTFSIKKIGILKVLGIF